MAFGALLIMTNVPLLCLLNVLYHLNYLKKSSFLILIGSVCLTSVHFSRSVMSDSLRPHESQHARPPCPSPTPRVHPDSRPSSQWWHPAISSSVLPFSSCPQYLPASESFPMSQLFTWGGQSTGVSALASFPPKKSQGWSPSEWTGWISLGTKYNTHELPPLPLCFNLTLHLGILFSFYISVSFLHLTFVF